MKDPLLGILMRMARGHLQNRHGWQHRMVGLMFRHYPGLINCRTFESFLMDYHEGTLAEPSRKRFERHLAMCGLCRASYQGYVRSIEIGKRLFETETGPLPEEVPSELVGAVVSAMRAKE